MSHKVPKIIHKRKKVRQG